MSLAAGAAAVLLSLQATSDLISLAVRLLQKSAPRRSGGSASRLLFLVPAHNEELLLGQTIRSLLTNGAMGVQATVLVVADNCDDSTALVAKQAGADVIERRDASLRGKPFAIAWALSRITLDSYDAVCVVDADCVVCPGFGRALLKADDVREVLSQPYIGVRNPSDSAITRLAHLYGLANNGLAFGLKSSAGLNVPAGAGLTLGVDLLKRRGWRAFSICEDWELYAQLTTVNERVRWVPDAQLLAQETRALDQSRTQRARWQAGKTVVLKQNLFPLLRGAASFRQKLDATAELIGLGPVTNSAISLLLAATAYFGHLDGGAWIASAALIGPLRLATYLSIALMRVEDRVQYLKALVYLPIYVLWRIASTITTLVRPPGSRWVRAERH